MDIHARKSDDGLCQVCGMEDTITELIIPIARVCHLPDNAYTQFNLGERCRLALEATLRTARKDRGREWV